MCGRSGAHVVTPEVIASVQGGPQAVSTPTNGANTMTTQAHALAERYIASWNETDALRRRSLIEDTYAEHARYTDPMVDAKGWEAIDATVAAVQNMFPGHQFALAGVVD